MPDLLAEIRAEVTGHGNTCTAGPLIASLPSEQREAIAQAQAERLPVSAIARAVRRWTGSELQAQTFARHLRGDCRCQP